MADRFDEVAGLIAGAIARRAFPAATIEVGRSRGAVWRHAAGALTYEPDAPRARDDTIFDLASLTKVIATATLMARAVDAGALDLDAPVAECFAAWRGADRAAARLRDLLSHSAGLTAYLPFFRDHAGRAEIQDAICRLPLESAPRSRSLYSDLGYILLGFVLDDAGPAASGAPAGLDGGFRQLAGSLTSAPLAFNPPREWTPRTAPTEVDPWRGRLLVGEVHDENAWALGGVAGHAGLFGTAAAVGDFARAVLRTIQGAAVLASPPTFRAFIQRADVPGSSRALGWDTMQPTSSCGTLLSASAIGHTGFTGTSLWIDPAQDLYVAFLTNRVHPTRDNVEIRSVRPRLHDAIVRALQTA